MFKTDSSMHFTYIGGLSRALASPTEEGLLNGELQETTVNKAAPDIQPPERLSLDPGAQQQRGHQDGHLLVHAPRPTYFLLNKLLTLPSQ